MSLDFAKLRETRAAHPEKLAEIYASRNRRDVIQGDGRLFIVGLGQAVALEPRDDDGDVVRAAGGVGRLDLDVSVGDGELKEITEREKAEIKRRRLREQAEAESFEDLVRLGASRGYSSPQGWAYRVIQSRKRRSYG